MVEGALKYRLMDLLACPICKTFPLELVVFSEAPTEVRNEAAKPQCEEYCGYHRRRVAEMKMEKPDFECKGCTQIIIQWGVLTCPKCGRWYPIIDEIPHMLPDELRNEREDRAFLSENRERIPKEVLERGKPFSL